MSKVLKIEWTKANGVVTTHEPYIDSRAACDTSAYAIGLREPNYPVPATTQSNSLWQEWFRTSWVNPDVINQR